MNKQERADTYDAVRRGYSAEEWKDSLTDDLKVRSILDVRTEGDELYYTTDEDRDFSSHEASGKGQEFLTCIDGSIYANNPAMLAYTEALYVFNNTADTVMFLTEIFPPVRMYLPKLLSRVHFNFMRVCVGVDSCRCLVACFSISFFVCLLFPAIAPFDFVVMFGE